MNKLLSLIIYSIISLALSDAKSLTPEGYYGFAYNKMSDMLAGRDSLSIKRAVFLAEWAYYEGNLDYQKDFCDEINRIAKFVELFYLFNNLNQYKTGKQIALNNYFSKPYSGNGYKPYTYNYEDVDKDVINWENQFVSKVLKTHVGQCRSLPWMYKIISQEIGADVSIALAPRHYYIMYKDEDNFTPENWINLELTSGQMVPAFCIKDNFEISDSAVLVGTYMVPLNDVQTVACQLYELALGYCKKFGHYNEFTFQCASTALLYYPTSPIAWIIQCKSLEQMTEERLRKNGNVWDGACANMMHLMEVAADRVEKTYMTEETPQRRRKWRKKVIEAQKMMNKRE